MPKYLIERLIPDADKLSAADLQGIAQKSCSVLNDMGPRIQWIQSLCHGGRDLLHLHHTQRGDASGTCAARRLPCRPDSANRRCD